MIYATPGLGKELEARLEQLARLRDALGSESRARAPWMGLLRRMAQASAIASSTSIEGYEVSPADAVALLSGAEPPGAADEDRLALACYARAMDHVGAMARDPRFRWSDRVILDLHFDACHFQRDRAPGLWRTGPVSVTGPDGRVDFRGPDPEHVPGLMTEVVDWLQGPGQEVSLVVRAAMAHLHIVSVHPFKDGNGRVARIVQSLVLTREGPIPAELTSIEEYLGRNTPAYYAALRSAQAGSYQPERDAGEWVRFCVEAHIAQARERLTQLHAAAARWERLEAEVERRGWPDRFAIALEQSLFGGADRLKYSREADVSAATATSDLRRLLDSGLLEQRGRGPKTTYLASTSLRSLSSR